jgi:uncharacterized membrane protein
MSNLVKRLVDAAHHFTALDFSILKIYVVTVGILLGTYFGSFFLNYIMVVWLVAVVTWIILIVRTIRYCKKKDA